MRASRCVKDCVKSVVHRLPKWGKRPDCLVVLSLRQSFLTAESRVHLGIFRWLPVSESVARWAGHCHDPLLPSLMLLRLLRTCDVLIYLSVIPNWAAAGGKTHLLGGKRTLIVKGSLLEKLLSYEDRKSWQSETESKRRERKSSRRNVSKKERQREKTV